jgi:hypothetical protein
MKALSILMILATVTAFLILFAIAFVDSMEGLYTPKQINMEQGL